jgi:hypothetical protein
MPNKKIIGEAVTAIAIIIIVGLLLWKISSPQENQPNIDESLMVNQSTASTTKAGNNMAATSTSNSVQTVSAGLVLPISPAAERITKKPFGLKVSPTNSPVKPEKFSGYHTGTDFEILPGEENKDVPIYAVCSGPLVYKNYVSGYGGVAIEQCNIDKQVVTVLYGHLKFASIDMPLKTQLKAGDKIAILGKGYSSETDGERKHLHLGIHIGAKIDLRGYVQTKPELAGWLDSAKYLPL